MDFGEDDIRAAAEMILKRQASELRDTVDLFWTNDCVAMLTEMSLQVKRPSRTYRSLEK